MTDNSQSDRLATIVPSNEQAAILERAVAGESLRILALAGTGKTTTLELITRALRGKRVLYLVFNRSQATLAKERFAHMPLVKPMTFHGLAYREIGVHYKARQAPNETVAETAWLQFLGDRGALREFRDDDRPRASRTIITTLKRYLSSAATSVTELHVPETDLDVVRIAHLTRRLWASLEQNDLLPITHDWYLKQFQLSQPALAADVVLFDEAQDSAPVSVDIVNQQPQIQRVFVGDVHQQLYEFRGAVNTLATIDLPAMPLTETRRFGPNIAAAANQVLAAKGERQRLKGIANDEGAVRTGHPLRNEAVLSRTNAGLVERALTLIDRGARIFIRGGTDPNTGRSGSGGGELMGSLLAAYDLRNDRQSSHPLFSRFRNWNDLTQAAAEDGGERYRPYVRLVERHGRDVPRVVAAIRDNTLTDEVGADVVLSTVHRFKGEERSTVALTSDFYEFVDAKGKLDEGEANIAYVALTRAKSALYYGGSFGTLETSLDRCGIRIVVSHGDKPAVSTPLPVLRARPKAIHVPAPPPRRTYRDLVPGTRWNHPQYGVVTIEDATAQLIEVTTSDGERKNLGTLIAYAKLNSAEDAPVG